MIAWLKRFSRFFQGLIGLGACWVLAVLYYRTWQTPLEVEGGAWVRFGFAMLGIEFVINLAGVFLTGLANPDSEVYLNGVRLRGEWQHQVRRRVLVFFFALFTVVGVGIAFSVGSRALLIGFLGLMLSRAIGFWSNSVQVNREQTHRFGLSVAFFVTILLLTIFIPFSSGGLTPEVLAQVYPSRGSGILADHPERAFVMGMIYFGSLGVAEVLMSAFPKSIGSRPDA